MRIGERNPNMPEEHRIIARYTAEKVKSHKKKSIFNLADDELLTHKGQLLTEIEKFENEASDNDDEDANNLEADFVKEAHFGGGLFHKVSSDGAKSHKDLINQLILESKKRKNERLKLKEQTLELTEKLDTEWKDLLPIVNASRKTTETEDPASHAKPKNDDYDKVMRELKFESRGNPSDRLKSEEEILKKEKEELAKFEKEREKRMHGGDDLEDNFMFEDVNDKDEESDEDSGDSDEVEEESVRKKQKTAESKQKSGTKELESDEEQEGDDAVNEVGEESDEEAEDEEKSDDEDSSSEGGSENKKINGINGKTEDIEEEEEDDDNISLSDLKVDASESSSSEDEIEEETIEKPSEKMIETKESHQKEEKEEKLSFEVKFPDSYLTLEATFESVEPKKLGVVLSKLIQLIAGNKDNSSILFSYSLQYLDSDSCTFKKLAHLLPSVFELAKINPEKTFVQIRDFLKDKHLAYRDSPKKYPSFSILPVLKVIGALYTTSDFRHGVVTPAFVFIGQMLTACRVKTRRDVAFGLFLVTLVLEYTALSKRFLPAAVSFLAGLIHMAVPKTGVKLLKVPPPFKHESTLLVLRQNMERFGGETLLQESDLRNASAVTPVFQVSALRLAVKLLQEMLANCKGLPSRCELFEKARHFLKLLPLDNYPSTVQKDAGDLLQSLQEDLAGRTLELITEPKKKPKLLRLYEPSIEKVYDGKKHKGKSREKMERDKMLHKIKRETKGAMREIRRDKSFLGRVQINRRIQSDAERKEKVKRIYSEAANQQAELNSLDRKRKKR